MAMTVTTETDSKLDPMAVYAFFPPVSDGLVGYYEFGGRLASSLANLANQSAPAVAVGNVIADAQSVLLSGSTGYIDTRLPQTSSFTIYAICWTESFVQDNTKKAMILSNYRSAGSGMSLYHQSNTPTAPAAATTLNAGCWTAGTVAAPAAVNKQRTQAVVDSRVPRLLCWRLAAGVGMTFNDGTANAGGVMLPYAEAPLLNAADTLRVGASAGATGWEGQIHMSRLAIYDNAHTDAGMLTMFAFLKAEVAKQAAPIAV